MCLIFDLFTGHATNQVSRTHGLQWCTGLCSSSKVDGRSDNDSCVKSSWLLGSFRFLFRIQELGFYLLISMWGKCIQPCA